MDTNLEFETLGGQPCGCEWQALLNLCDMYGMELRENKYNRMGDNGYTVILRNADGQKSASAHIPQDMTLAQATDWVKGFYETYRR